MEGQFQTSFIPKRPIIQKPDGKPARPINFFMIIMVFIFITVILLAAAVFAYHLYLEKSVESKKEKLADAVKQLDPKTVEQIARTDLRIETTKKFLKQHIALTDFFDFLNKTTIVNVRFDSFSYQYTADQKIAVTMTGLAKGFSDIAVQAQTFADPQYANKLHNPVFSGLSLDKQGYVVFKFTADLDPAVYSYEKILSTQPAPATPNLPVDNQIQASQPTQ